MWLGWFCFRFYFDSFWSYVLPTATFFESKLVYSSFTYAFFNVNFFKFTTVEVIIKHCFKVSIVPFVARPVIVDGIGKECIEAKTY